MALLEEQAGRLDINLDEGTDFSTELTWSDENDVPIDLTDYTAKLQMRSKAGGSGTPDLELTHLDGITLGGNLGTIVLDIPKIKNTFGSKSFVYDLELSDAAGDTFRLLKGTITSSAEVTK